MEMPNRPTLETKPRDTASARPKLILDWRLDPVTGKPEARWTREQSRTIPNLEYLEAA